MALLLDVLTGPSLQEIVPDLARLRIAVFREFPYLYDGDEGYELRYLETYLQAKNAMVAVVRDAGRVVGASTCVPLLAETPEVQTPFLKAGLEVTHFLYLGESVLLPEHRGLGWGLRFFEAREAHAKTLGLQHTTFCAVERRADHPRRPEGYVPLDAFWQKRGYAKREDLRTVFSWQDLDETTASEKPMVFWTRTLLG